MSFSFRGTNLALQHYCLVYNNGYMVRDARAKRYEFFQTPNPNISNCDLCHHYSFDSICHYICNCVNGIISGNEDSINNLLLLLPIFYPMPEVLEKTGGIENVLSPFLDYSEPNDITKIFPKCSRYKEDYLSACNVVKKIISNNSDDDLILEYSNELLYILNNAKSNLRYGDSGWNRSLGSAYDPDDGWYYENNSDDDEYDDGNVDDWYDDERSNEEWRCKKWNYEKDVGLFIINNQQDIYRLALLCSIKMDLTFDFVTADEDNYDAPILYSSQNSFPLPAADEVKPCNQRIALKKLDGGYIHISSI